MRAISCAYRGLGWCSVAACAAVCVAALTGCRPPVAGGDWPQGETVGELRVGRPVSHANLTIFPVYSRTAKNEDRFITLDEGLKAGTVRIMETGAVGDGVAMNSDAAVELNDDGAAEARLGNSQATDSPTTQADDPFGDAPAASSGDDDGGRIVELIEQAVAGAGVDGDVNRLMVVNNSDKPLYLMPGEVIVGGKQDRTIGQEIVIAPSKKPVPIDAFCVEHGRWNERGAAGLAMLASGGVSAAAWDEAGEGSNGIDLANAGTLAGYAAQETGFRAARISSETLGKAAAKADRGEFVAPAGSVNSKVRFAIVGVKDQGDIWDEVAKTNAATGNAITDATGGFTGNYFDPQVLEKIDPYVAKLNGPIAATGHVVGVVVAIDGKFVTMDVFESTPLFAKLWPKLLRSYALDAAIATADRASETEAEDGNSDVVNDADAANTAGATPKKPLRIADARAFLADALNSTAAETRTDDGVVMTKREGEYCVSFTAHKEEQVPFVTSVIPVIDSPPAGNERSAGYGGRASLGGANAAGIHTSAFGK